MRIDMYLHGTFEYIEYIPFTYYYGLGLHLRLPFAPFLLTLFGKIQKEAGKQKETENISAFVQKCQELLSNMTKTEVLYFYCLRDPLCFQ